MLIIRPAECVPFFATLYMAGMALSFSGKKSVLIGGALLSAAGWLGMFKFRTLVAFLAIVV